MSECSVCMVNRKSHVLVPFGHLCVCQECAGNFTFPLHKQFLGKYATVKEEVEFLQKLWSTRLCICEYR